jgi:hypothetical protein
MSEKTTLVLALQELLTFSGLELVSSEAERDCGRTMLCY